ncbi:MAG: hypothetical protein EOM64_01010 [Erysipelotrichia bacterium]|nr:hypothetical protein [Erysipelotrichia bacterium]
MTVIDGQSKIYREKVIESMYLKTFFVLILVSISSVLCISVNSIVISRYLGSAAMSSYGLADPYFLLISSVGSLFSIGTQVVCAEKIAKGDLDSANKAFATSFWTVMCVSLLIAVLGVVFSDPLALFLSSGRTSAEGVVMLKTYLIGLFCSSPAFTGNLLLVPAMQLDGETKRAKYATIIMSITNVAIVTIGIILLKQGMIAVSIGRMAAYWSAFIILLLHFRKKGNHLKLAVHGLDIKLLKGIISVGVPKALRTFYDLFYKIILNKWILFLGASTLMSSIAVQNSIHYFPDMLSVGMQGTIMMLVSIYIGETDKDSLHNLIRVSKKYYLLFILPVSLLGVLLSGAIARLYIVDSDTVLKLASYAIAWYFACLPFSTFNDCYIGFYQGLKKTRTVNTLMMFGRIILPLAMSLLLGSVWGPFGLIAAMGISSVTMTLGIILVKSIKKRSFIFKLTDLAETPVQLDSQDHHVFYTTVKTMEEAAEVSAILPEKLRLYHLPEKQVQAISLCTEEMVRRIIENDDGKKARPFIDIGISIDSGNVEIHFRDNLKQYDFCEDMNNCWSADNLSGNIGYRILAGLSSDIRYMFLMDTNVIVMKINSPESDVRDLPEAA